MAAQSSWPARVHSRRCVAAWLAHLSVPCKAPHQPTLAIAQAAGMRIIGCSTAPHGCLGPRQTHLLILDFFRSALATHSARLNMLSSLLSLPRSRSLYMVCAARKLLCVLRRHLWPRLLRRLLHVIARLRHLHHGAHLPHRFAVVSRVAVCIAGTRSASGCACRTHAWHPAARADGGPTRRAPLDPSEQAQRARTPQYSRCSACCAGQCACAAATAAAR